MLTVVFLISVLVFSVITNKVNKDLTTTMDEASLPIMHFVYDDKVVNELHGYVQEMDMLSMRDGLLPIGKERGLHLEIMTYGNSVDNLSYEIRSIDGERLLVEEDDADITVTQDKVNCDISLPSLFEDNQEYNMKFTVTMADKEVYYYTRIVRTMDYYTDESLDFALTFHDYTFRDDAKDFIPTYMDPATGDATTLNYVDLTCTLRQITWADFTGVKLTEPVASFKEVSSSYNVITLNYVMTNVNENDEVEYYNVEEYYRLRYTPTRTYVLNFERRMNQIFRNENNFLLGTTGILLGIRDNDVEYLANDSGNCIAFVQEGELWSYDRANHMLSQIFTFRGAEGINNRENWNQHDIQIIRVDEAGTVSFVVAGYMNRGVHEGKVGIGVYRYDGISHTVEEEIFISSDKSYEVLQAEMGNLLYVNDQKILYLTLNDDVYTIDMNTFSIKTLLENETEEGYAVSNSGRYLAWVREDALYSSRIIHLEDLKTGTSHEIKAPADCYVLPIDFIGEDFIYGIANAQDVKRDEWNDVIFPMSELKIMNTSEEKQEIIKTYSSGENRIGTVRVDDRNIYVELVIEEDGRLEVCGADTIMNRESEPANGVKLKKSVTTLKQTQVAINMKEVKKTSAAQLITPKHILLEQPRIVEFAVETEGLFYAYARGKVLLATKDVGKAIRCANENFGVVVDANLQYVFKRARNTTQSALTNLSGNEADANATSFVKAISVMLSQEGVSIGVKDMLESGQTPIQILQTTLRSSMILELEECTIDEVLYYIDQGTPVLARTGVDQAVLLTGYSSKMIYYYDPVSGTDKSANYEDMESLVEAGGNYFIAYVK